MAKLGKEEPVAWVYTKRIRLRNGKVIYAHDYGLKAFRFQGGKRQRDAA